MGNGSPPHPGRSDRHWRGHDRAVPQSEALTRRVLAGERLVTFPIRSLHGHREYRLSHEEDRSAWSAETARN